MSSTFEGVDSYTKSFKEIRKNELFESTKDLKNKMALKYLREAMVQSNRCLRNSFHYQKHLPYRLDQTELVLILIMNFGGSTIKSSQHSRARTIKLASFDQASHTIADYFIDSFIICNQLINTFIMNKTSLFKHTLATPYWRQVILSPKLL